MSKALGLTLQETTNQQNGTRFSGAVLTNDGFRSWVVNQREAPGNRESFPV